MNIISKWLRKSPSTQSPPDAPSATPTFPSWQHRAHSPTQREGMKGEHLARDYLTAQGLTWVASNVACPMGEIDLIMREGQLWVFVEVKMRRSNQFGGAAAAITPQKLARMHKMATWYLIHHLGSADVPCRLDALLIQGKTTQGKSEAPQIEWLTNISL